MVMADKVRGVVGVCISLGRRLAFSSSPAARSITASPASAFSKGFPVVVKAVLPLSIKSGMQFLPRLFTYTVSERSNWSFQGISTDAQKATPAVGVVNDETFKELVLDSNIPVLVDFWAPWCGPCHMIAPLIEDLGRQYVGKLKCFKLNIDENPNVASAYAIQSIPTIMIFVGGEKRDAILGAVPKSTLTAMVDKHLGV